MGLLNRKQQQDQPDGVLHFFDTYFRDELRQQGREYFQKVIDENAAVLKEDLSTIVAQVDGSLKEHIANQLDTTLDKISNEINRQLDEQFIEYGKAMKDTQDAALQSLNSRTQALEGQYQQLVTMLEKRIAEQDAALAKVFEGDMARLTSMKNAQDAALQSLAGTVQVMQQQYQQMGATIQKQVADQEAILVGAFEQNMAKVVEHYLLEALGDQYDLKAQLPAIIKQMEENKQTIADDMKL